MTDSQDYEYREALRNLYRLSRNARDKGQKPQRFIISKDDSLALRIGLNVPALSLNGGTIIGIPCSDDGASTTTLLCYPGA